MTDFGTCAISSAIIRQAIRDYRYAYECLRKNPDDTNAMMMMGDVVTFFLSEWYTELTDIDGRVILTALINESWDDGCRV